ncbi:MAG: Gfo/Idh/MocA family oxidoreductase [Chloroflexi bacterium]|nr:Gfo/Idh/MocA family oxidoreductase [Chloroflexota bacterium]MCI0576869.1 Gfo/Idh/MocA family oxidoreductase [Chloroflexota bacterium]MCI0646477.1 Gfo/Idh/MocA family oxidoreductase [Chloroflexota bacterium]MCI0726171.1 Gfo/Idh/MocA family oxidoreductase [Chloroflexota bacterium]
MYKPIRMGLVGAGQRGQHHLNDYRQIEGAEIVAVADINEGLARRVAAEFNIPNVYTDYRELLQRDDIEAVDVCLHNNLHRPVAVAAMEAGKDVYCEKPMAGSYADAKAMVDAAQALGRKLAIQLFTLFRPQTRAAKTLIEGGYLGELYHARSTGFRRRGRPYVDGYGTATFVQKRHAAGGAIYDMGVYHIARLLYLLGNPAVERITGKTYQKTPMDAARQKASGYDVEELGLGFVHFTNGVTLDIIEAWAIHLDGLEGSSVVGTLGGIRLDPFGYYHNLGDLEVNSTVDLERIEYRWKNVHDGGDVYDSSEHHWIAALQGRVDLLPSAELALNTMLISEGIYLSDDLGREVTAGEVRERSVSLSTL